MSADSLYGPTGARDDRMVRSILERRTMIQLLVLWLVACGGPEAPETPEPAARKVAPAGKAPAKAGKGGKAALKSKAPAGAKATKGPKATPAAKKPSAGKPMNARGVLHFADDGATLALCDGGDPVALKAGTGDPARVRGALGDDVQDVYVELRGFREGDGPITVRAFDLAIADGPGCDAPLEATMKAMGNEPFWSLSLDGVKATLTRPDGDTSLGELAHEGSAQRTHTFQLDGGTFVVSRKRCSDTMATAFYPFTATLTLGDETLEGCARGRVPGLGGDKK